MKWKILLGTSLLVSSVLGGWWFWLRSSAENEPLVFENASLESKQATEQYDSAQEVREELSPELHTSSTSQAASTSEHIAPPPSLSSPSPTPAETTPLPTLQVTDHLLSFGFRTPPSPRTINTLVLHSSYNASGGDSFQFDKIIGQYEQYGVGAHYIIDRSGRIFRLVREEDIAYHAGESKMPDGRKNVNDFSIGIELIGTEESGFTEKEYAALNDLIADIKTRYKIKDIVGHSDIAPTRKTDPWKFDWKKLK
ncbi:MAG: hypothetical protein E6P95_02625 [Candidatus Moraniibacteriota bacterium]|nr:MAG: hypothetical protein E6P95_02625 [Candidatus Moranbacteria bacterium]